MGGGGEAPIRRPEDEFKKIGKLFQGQVGNLNQFTSGQPLLNAANQGALGFFGGLGSLIQPLQGMLGSYPGLFGNLYGGMSNLLGPLQSLTRQSGGLASRIPDQAALTSPFMSAFHSQIAPVLRSGGALTPEQERQVTQATRAQFAAQGNAGGNQALGATLLNRQGAQQQRFNTALGQGQAASNQVMNLAGQNIGLRSGLIGQQAGLLGQQGGLYGGLSNLLGTQAGTLGSLAGGIQNLQGGGLNQLLGTQTANTGNFANIMNPLLGYTGQLFQGNQLSQLQQNAADQGKGAGLAGGGLSLISSILPLFFSDERLKTNIKNLGFKSSEGIPIKSFQFKGDKNGPHYIGVLSKDVKKKVPGAVAKGPGGFEMVDFSQISAPNFAIGQGGKQSMSSYSGGLMPNPEINNNIPLPTGGMGENPWDLNFHSMVPEGGGYDPDAGDLPPPASGFNPDATWDNPNPVPPPQGAGQLVRPPGVNMPPNQQPAPPWMKWMPPQVQAGYKAWRLGQRGYEMIRDWFGSKPGGGGGGGGSKLPFQGWGFWGQNPGDNPQFVQWARPEGFGPRGANPSQPGWIGSTPFGVSSGNTPPSAPVWATAILPNFGAARGPTNLTSHFGPTGAGPYGLLNLLVQKGAQGAGGGPRMNPRKE